MKIKDIVSKKQNKNTTTNSVKDSMFRNPPPRQNSTEDKSPSSGNMRGV